MVAAILGREAGKNTLASKIGCKCIDATASSTSYQGCVLPAAPPVVPRKLGFPGYSIEQGR